MNATHLALGIYMAGGLLFTVTYLIINIKRMNLFSLRMGLHARLMCYIWYVLVFFFVVLVSPFLVVYDLLRKTFIGVKSIIKGGVL